MNKLSATTDKFFWRQAKRNGKEVNVCLHMLFGGLLAVAMVSTAVAEPVYNAGGANTNHDAPTGTDHMVVNQTGGASSIANVYWHSFDTDVGQTVTFNQTATQTAINRIAGSNHPDSMSGETIFNGGLSGAGTIVLMNQNGFLFGGDSTINVGSFMATTNENALSFTGDRWDFADWVEGQSVGNYAEIINNGSITITKNGGFGYLVAPYVENNGTVKNDDGASGVAIGLGSINVTQVMTMDTSCYSDCSDSSSTGRTGVVNTENGTLQGRSGYVAMVGAIYGASVNVGGIVDADQFAAGDDGGAILVKSQGDIELNGADIHAIGGQYVEAGFYAAHDIVSTEDTTSKIVLKAQEGNAEERLWDEWVEADLDMEAYGEGDANGDIIINSDITVQADAFTANSSFSYTSGSDTSGAAGAHAHAEISAEGAIYIETGEDTIRVVANNNTELDPDGYKTSAKGIAEALLEIDADKDITIDGHVVVEATATGLIDHSGYSDSNDAYTSADADVDIDSYDGSVKITGNIDVLANADGYADFSSSSYYDYTRNNAEADADVQVTAYGGGVEIDGDIDVDATADTWGEADHYNGYYYSYAYINGDADADADAEIEAYGGNASITGDIDVTAAATTHADLSDDGYDGYGGYGGYGDVHGYAEAIAEIDIDTSHDVIVTGNLTSDADALNERTVDSEWDIWRTDASNASASIEINDELELFGGFDSKKKSKGYYGLGDVTIEGDMSATATADNDGGEGSSYATADAWIDVRATENIAITGNSLVTATADTSSDVYAYDYGYDGGEASAHMVVQAGLGIGGGYDGYGGPVPLALVEEVEEEPEYTPGNLDYIGDVTVTSNSNGNRAESYASGVFSATGDVFIDTDPFTITANTTGADDDYYYGDDEGQAHSQLAFCAGIGALFCDDGAEGGYGGQYISEFDEELLIGDLTIFGDVSAIASTNSGDGEDDYWNYRTTAFTGLIASGDIFVRYHDIPPTAQATHNGTTARVSQDSTAHEECYDGSCTGVVAGWGDWELEDGDYYSYNGEGWGTSFVYDGGEHIAAQLAIESLIGEVDIAPKERTQTGPNELLGERLFDKPFDVPGDQPLRFAANGDMFAATGTGVTLPPSVEVMNVDIEAALLSGADPSTLLSPTAAGPGSQASLVGGQDSMTMIGPDFCDSLVSGACFESEK